MAKKTAPKKSVIKPAVIVAKLNKLAVVVAQHGESIDGLRRDAAGEREKNAITRQAVEHLISQETVMLATFGMVERKVDALFRHMAGRDFTDADLSPPKPVSTELPDAKPTPRI